MTETTKGMTLLSLVLEAYPKNQEEQDIPPLDKIQLFTCTYEIKVTTFRTPMFTFWTGKAGDLRDE